MGVKDLQKAVNNINLLDIEEIISIAKRMGKTNITFQDLDDNIKTGLKDLGYVVYTCERPRIGGHTRFIHLTMIDWSHMEENND